MSIPFCSSTHDLRATASKSSSTFAIPPSPFTRTTSACTRAISITRSSSGSSSASSLLACTTTLSKCLCAPRKPSVPTAPALTPSHDAARVHRERDPATRSSPVLSLHAPLSLWRARRRSARLLHARDGAVRQGWRCLHLERCPRRLRPYATPSVRRDVASTQQPPPAPHRRNWPRTR